MGSLYALGGSTWTGPHFYSWGSARHFYGTAGAATSRITQEPLEHQAIPLLGGADGRLRDGGAAPAPSGDALVIALNRRHDVPDQLRGACHEAVHGSWSFDAAAPGVPTSRLSRTAAAGRAGG